VAIKRLCPVPLLRDASSGKDFRLPFLISSSSLCRFWMTPFMCLLPHRSLFPSGRERFYAGLFPYRSNGPSSPQRKQYFPPHEKGPEVRHVNGIFLFHWRRTPLNSHHDNDFSARFICDLSLVFFPSLWFFLIRVFFSRRWSLFFSQIGGVSPESFLRPLPFFFFSL